MKKMLAILLASTMCVSVAGTTGFAAEINAESAAETMSQTEAEPAEELDAGVASDVEVTPEIEAEPMEEEENAVETAIPDLTDTEEEVLSEVQPDGYQAPVFVDEDGFYVTYSEGLSYRASDMSDAEIAELPYIECDAESELSYEWSGLERSGSTVSLGTEADLEFDPALYKNITCTVSDQYGNKLMVTYYIYINNRLRFDENDNTTITKKLMYSLSDANETQLLTAPDVTSMVDCAISYSWSGYKKNGDYVSLNGNGDTIQVIPAEYSQIICYVKDAYDNSIDGYFTFGIENHLMFENGDEDYYEERGISPSESSRDLMLTVPEFTCDDDTDISYMWYGVDEDNNETVLDSTGNSCVVIPRNYKNVYVDITDRYGNVINAQFRLKIENHLLFSNGSSWIYCDVNISPSLKDEEKTISVPAFTCDDMTGITYRWDGYDSNDNYVSGISTSNSVAIIPTDYSELVCYISDQYGNRITAYLYIKLDNQLKFANGSSRIYPERTYSPSEATVTQTLEIPEFSCLDDSDISYEWYGYDKDGHCVDISSTDATCEIIPAEFNSVYFSITDRYDNYISGRYSIEIENHLRFKADDSTYYSGKNKYTIAQAKVAQTYTVPEIACDDASGITYTWYTYSEDYSRIDLTGTGNTCKVVPLNYKNVYCTISDTYGNSIQAGFYYSVENNFKFKSGDTRINQSIEIPSTNVPKTYQVKLPELSGDDLTGVTINWYAVDSNYNSLDSAKYTVSADKKTITIPVIGTRYVEAYIYDKYNNSLYARFDVSIENNHVFNYDYSAGNSSDSTEIQFSATQYYKRIRVTPGESVQLTVPAYSETVKDGVTTSTSSELLEKVSNTVYKAATKTASYVISIVDKFGNSVRAIFTVTVDSGLELTTPAVSPDVISIGDTGTTTITGPVYKVDSGEVHYQWYKGNYYYSYSVEPTLNKYNKTAVDGVDNKITIDNSTISNKIAYQLVVTDDYGNEESHVYIVTKNALVLKDGTSSYSTVYSTEKFTGTLTKTLSVDDLIAENGTDYSYAWYIKRAYSSTTKDYTNPDFEGKYAYDAQYIDKSIEDDTASTITVNLPDTNSYEVGCRIYSGSVYITVAWRFVADKQTYTVTYDSNGGYQPAYCKSEKIVAGGKIGSLQSVQGRHGQSFLGWYTAKTGGTKLTSSTVVNGNMTVYAHWSACKRHGTFTNNICPYCKSYETVATPAISSATNAATGITLKWSAVAHTQYYRIYRKPAGGSYTAIASAVSGTTYTDTTAVSGTTYTYAIRCLSADKKAFISNINTTGKSVLRLSNVKPTVANATTGVKLTWTKVAGATGYKIYRKTGTGSYAGIKTVTSATLTFTDTTAVSGTTYTYAVRAYNGTTVGTYTGVSVKYLKAVTPTVANAASFVSVKWTKVTGATGYYVYRKTGSGSYAKVATVTTLSYTDTKAVNGTTYTYAVRPYSGTTMGAFTGVANVRLTPVTSTVSSPATKQIKVNWTKNAYATGYQIQYSTVSTFTGTTTKLLTVKGPSVLTYTIKNLLAKKGYYVRVRAYKTVGTKNYYSSFSATKTITTK